MHNNFPRINETSVRSRQLLFLSILISLLCAPILINAQNKKKYQSIAIKPFTITIWDSDYSVASSVGIFLIYDKLKIILKANRIGGKDSLLFSKELLPSDTLLKISTINLDSLQTNYYNPCVWDGSQITIIMYKNGKKKSIHLSNFYQKDIGQMIALVNTLLPEQFRVWYDKEDLIDSYKKCQDK